MEGKIASEREQIAYEKWKKTKEGFFPSMVKNISPTQFILIIALIGLFIYFIYASKNNFVKFLFGALIIIIILFFYSKNSVLHLITEQEAKMIAGEVLKRKVGTDELPTGTETTVGHYCSKYKGNWEVQITIKYPDGLVKEAVMFIKILGGEVEGIAWVPTGYMGRLEKEEELNPVFVEKFTEAEEV